MQLEEKLASIEQKHRSDALSLVFNKRIDHTSCSSQNLKNRLPLAFTSIYPFTFINLKKNVKAENFNFVLRELLKDNFSLLSTEKGPFILIKFAAETSPLSFRRSVAMEPLGLRPRQTF